MSARRAALTSLVLASLLFAGCVPAQQYDQLQADYQQLKVALGVDPAEITQLQGRLR